MDISLLSLVIFSIITYLYFALVKPTLTIDVLNTPNGLNTYYSSTYSKLGIYLLAIILSQCGLNFAYLANKCGGNLGKNAGVAFIFTIIPWLLIFAFISITLVWYISSQTLLGKRIYAVGSNPEGAISRGLSFNRITILVFVFLGVLAGVGGVLYTARYATINPADVGRGLEFDVISAVVIGGTNIFGGSGTALGTALGCLLIGILSNGLTVVGVSPFWKACATGFLILLAVTVDNVVRRKQEQKFLLAIRNQGAGK